MINLLLGLGLALAVILLSSLLKISLWISIPMGLVAGFALFVWLGRRTQAALEAIMAKAGAKMSGEAVRSEAMRNRKLDEAIEIMKEGYPLGKRQFFIKGAIDGQTGILRYLQGRPDEAEPLLKAATGQHYVAKAMLGVLQWKRGQKKMVRETFDLALKSGKKESLLYGVYAYVLNEMGDRDGAIEVMNKGLKVLSGDERLEKNRNLLQNAKPMKMSLYGEQWYQFMIERPKVMQEPPPFARMSRRAMRG
ncbi:MAG TPA: hypothetical protein VL181_04210 [Holophagaceae bacterium]|nr:hypothetical protein [Holophagaceae bacterium]